MKAEVRAATPQRAAVLRLGFRWPSDAADKEAAPVEERLSPTPSVAMKTSPSAVLLLFSALVAIVGADLPSQLVSRLLAGVVQQPFTVRFPSTKDP